MPRRKNRSEWFFWTGVVLWFTALVFWRPEPSVSFADAPSASPRPQGFAVFHDLVAMDAGGARRYLGRPSELPEEIGVAVLLSPKEPVPSSHRKEMLEWVEEKGGTLIVGYPIHDRETQKSVNGISDGTDRALCSLKPTAEAFSASLYYVSERESEDPKLSFSAEIGRVFDPESCYGDLLLVDDDGRIAATVEHIGKGTVVQLADSRLVDNEALGRKRTHLFASELVARFGKERIWAFDEAYEGIHPSPKFVELVGAGRWRPVFLQIALIMLLGYWSFSMTLGRRRELSRSADVREATTRAKDIGDFYQRAQKSRFVLVKSIEYLKAQAKIHGADGEAKKEALALIKAAEDEYDKGETHMDRHAYLAKKMAVCGRALETSSKGRRYEPK